MGIPKLTSFVDRHFVGWKREKITGHLVIDGFSLCYDLYSFDWRQGGQYPQFHDCIVEYFESLRLSKIEPIVVFDGVDYKQEKVKTTMRRRKEAVERTTDLMSRQADVRGNMILPMLAIETFQHTLSSIHVRQIVVDGEADIIIVQLANFYACPVLSKDSDFYMYALNGGFIPMNMFHWNCKPIMAEVYHVQAFIDQFKLRHESVRLIIPAIAGNDFLPTIQFAPTFESIKGNVILSIVNYASHFHSFDDFMSKLPSVDCFLEKDALLYNCRECKMYDCHMKCSLDEVLSQTELHAFDNSAVPRWILDQFRVCNFRRSVMEAFILHKCVLRIAVDDWQKPSSLLISRSLRQAIYCILNIETITEYVRHRRDIVGEKVNTTTCADVINLPSLVEIPSLKLHEKNTILYSILQCSIQDMEKLDHEWRLVAASVGYWVFHAKVPAYVVKALLLCFVYCSHAGAGILEEFRSLKLPFEFIQTPKWLSIVHFIAQWQSVYLDAVSLNQLLQLPLVNHSPAKLYDGEILMRFATLNDIVLSAEAKLSAPQQRFYQILLDVVSPHISASKTSVSKKVVTQHKHASSTKSSRVRTKFEHVNRFSALSTDSGSEELSSTESD